MSTITMLAHSDSKAPIAAIPALHPLSTPRRRHSVCVGDIHVVIPSDVQKHIMSPCTGSHGHALVATPSDDGDPRMICRIVDGHQICTPFHGHGTTTSGPQLPAVPRRAPGARRSTLCTVANAAGILPHVYPRSTLPRRAGTVAVGPMTPPLEETEEAEDE